MWGDLLTSYDGQTITADEIGNMLTDGTWTYTWEHGRELASMSDGSTTWNYEYNADGLRTKRTNGTNTYYYYYAGGQLLNMRRNYSFFRFAYDASGAPMTVIYGGETYFYVTNIQGDVIAILDDTGATVVEYIYDAWGNVLTTTGSMASTLGETNPLRYRGYVYDEETRLYYLQSRYYNPEMGRFINADAFTSTGQGVLGNNMFAYCNNNPIIHADSEGTFFFTVIGAAVGAVVGAVDAWIMGGNAEDIAKAAEAGAWAGAIAGAGVDVGVMVVASGGSMGVALGIVAGTGALSGIVGTGVSSDWQAEPSEYLGSAVIAAGLNLLSFGTAPINGEIAKDSIRHMIDNIFLVSSINCPALLENTVYSAIIAEASIWVYRVITGNSE